MNIIEDKEFGERVTGMLQDRWLQYVRLRGLTKKQQSRHLSAFLEGGQAVLDTILTVHSEEME